MVGPFVGARLALGLQEKRNRHERRMTDLSEVRRLIDDAITNLEEVQIASSRYLSGFDQATTDRFVPGVVALATARARLAIRLGRHESSGLVNALREAQHSMQDLIEAGIAAGGGEALPEAITDPLLQRFGDAQTRFLDLALALVAAELPSAERAEIARVVHTSRD